MSGAREADDGNGGDGKVQDERRWSHHLGGNPSQGHQGEISRCPGMADGRVEEGDQEEAEREKGKKGVRHARIIRGGAERSEARGVHYPYP